MLRMSVVGFNSTISRAQSYYSYVTSISGLPLRTIKFCSVLFGVSVQACCHKQGSLKRGLSSSDSLRLRNKQTPPRFTIRGISK